MKYLAEESEKLGTEQFPSTYQFPRNWEQPRVQPSPLTKPWWLKLASPKAIPKSIKREETFSWSAILKSKERFQTSFSSRPPDQCSPVLIKQRGRTAQIFSQIYLQRFLPLSLPLPPLSVSRPFKFNFQNLAGRRKNFPSPEFRPRWFGGWLRELAVTFIGGRTVFHFDLSRGRRDGRRRGFLVIWQGETGWGCTRRIYSG